MSASTKGVYIALGEEPAYCQLLDRDGGSSWEVRAGRRSMLFSSEPSIERHEISMMVGDATLQTGPLESIMGHLRRNAAVRATEAGHPMPPGHEPVSKRDDGIESVVYTWTWWSVVL